MVFCIHIGQRVEAWSANFCLFRGREVVSSETNFVRFAGLLRTSAMAPNGACAHYVIVSKFQWKPFWLATQREPQND